MSIALAFGDDGMPPRWNPEEAAKLEAAVEVLQRRHDLSADRPDELRYIWHAIGALWPVLSAASDDPRYAQEHPAEVAPEDLPF